MSIVESAIRMYYKSLKVKDGVYYLDDKPVRTIDLMKKVNRWRRQDGLNPIGPEQWR